MDELEQVDIPDDALFWELVALANQDWDQFAKTLREQPTPRVAGFAAMFHGLSAIFFELANSALGSEDAGEDLGEWIVAQGKEYFCHVLADPARIEEAAARKKDAGPDILGLALEIYEEREDDELFVWGGELFDIYDTDYATRFDLDAWRA